MANQRIATHHTKQDGHLKVIIVNTAYLKRLLETHWFPPSKSKYRKKYRPAAFTPNEIGILYLAYQQKFMEELATTLTNF